MQIVSFTGKRTKQVIASQNLVSVLIESVTPCLDGYSEQVNEYNLNENTDCVMTGKLDTPDLKFRIPFKRLDTGRTQIMPAEVVNGELTIKLNFKTSGLWIVNKELFNFEFASPKFAIEEQKFWVV